MNEPQGYTQALVDILNSKLAQDIMAAYDQGAKDKEDAIIKLLEAFGTDGKSKSLNPFHCDLCLTLASLIALIKGENK